MLRIRQNGFTVLEVILLLVFLGIVAALIVPRYLALQNSAIASELKAVIGAVESGSAKNFARYITAGPFRGAEIEANDSCEGIAIAAALPNGLPEGYHARGEKVMAYSGEYYGTCTITHEVTGEVEHAIIMLTRVSF
ncbi:MAG: type II secretion system protein [Gammaproteobacteria bacterium]